MEFDVINDILTETCEKLFSNKPVYNFRKQADSSSNTSSQPQSRSSLNTSVQSSQSITNTVVHQSEVSTLENWISTIGPQKLQQSLRKLNIDLPKLTKKDLEVQNTDQLNGEKKRVKNELKSYDAAFQSIFGRFPQRTEKEPMRPLYIYYKKLKQYIDKIPPQPVTQTQKVQAPQHQASQMTQIEIIRRIDEQKKVRSELREKLNTFQNEFSSLHNRKIRFHKDIAPVEKEYKMYKDIKLEIQKLEGMLKK